MANADASDAGPDAAPSDVGLPDSGSSDMGPPDVGPPDVGPADALDDDAICTQGCHLGTQAGCDTDEAMCIATCGQDFAMRICYPEKIAAQLCVIAIGPGALTCMNGRTFIKTGTCEPEKGALTMCLSGTRADAGND